MPKKRKTRRRRRRGGLGRLLRPLSVLLGDNLVLLDKYRIAQRIYTELPYVTEARINRKFPSTLVLEVTETTAVASIQGAGGYWLLSAGEKLLEAVDETGAQDYLRITGLEAVNPAVSARLELPEDSPITLERLGQLLSAMERLEMLGRADGLDLSDRSDLVLGYDGRFQVIISYDADFDYKLLCLLEAVKCLEPNERGTIRLNMKEANKAHFIPASE